MLAVVLAKLVKLVVIFKLELANISKRISSCIFLNIYLPPQHSYNCLPFKIIDKANSRLDLKTKEAWHIHWAKPNLNVQQKHSALTFSLQLVPVLCYYLSIFLPFLFTYCFRFIWHLFSSFFTALVTLCYYFISI